MAATGISLNGIAVLKLHTGYPGRGCINNLMHGHGMPQVVSNDSVEWGLPEEVTATYYVSVWTDAYPPFICCGPVHVHAGDNEDTLLLRNISLLISAVVSVNEGL
jgi:hypothetical protein